jgi:hypothetical protein
MKIDRMMLSFLICCIFLINSIESFRLHLYSSQSSIGNRKNVLQSTSTIQDIATQPGYVEPEKILFPDNLSNEWEIDCYSRPALADDGKKLWELLITDHNNNGHFKYLKIIPSNLVNSRNVRKIVEDVIDISPIRPKSIRFFRNQMFNMLNIALSNLGDIDVIPTRRTYNLYNWLQDREDYIYPKLKGYNPTLKQQTILDIEVSKPDRLPDVLRAEKYAFVALPAEVFWNQQINQENIQIGKLMSLQGMPKVGWIHGITLFSQRGSNIAAWMNGLELSSIKCDLLGRQLLLNTGINTQYIVAPLTDSQKKEAQLFEKGKTEAMGFHFLSIQLNPESEGVEGFWLLRQYGNNL